MRTKSFSRTLRFSYLASLFLGVLLLTSGTLVRPAMASQSDAHIDVATFKLPITPVSAQYYERLVHAAEDDGAEALVIQIDTPGGLVESMQGMVQTTLASRVPIIAYISPQGAMASSAGVFIVYASHIAAISPNSTIGSASVLLDSGGGGGGAGTPESVDSATLRRKMTNMLVSLIQNLAKERGRDADFAEKSITEAKNVGAEAALQQHIVDIMAPNLDDLLKQVDGRKVTLQSGTVTLHTKDVPVRNISRTWVEDILFLLTDPSVAFLLISLGTLGITWEFINPGSVFPGVIGALLLLIGLLALGTLPINVAGLVFLALAFVLFVADVFMPTHGILTAGGIVSLVLGGMLLINTGAAPGIPGVSPYTVAGVALALGAFFFFAVYKVFMARKMRPATGYEGLIGKSAEARTDLAPNGMVFVQGELWQGVSASGPIPAGSHVRVTGTSGLQLKVEPEDAFLTDNTEQPRRNSAKVL